MSQFNFHRYDNLKHAVNKKDPRRHKYETKGLNIVSLLFSAAAGDATAMRRYKLSGVDMTQTDYDQRTALHLASAEGHIECVEFLLKYCQVPPNPSDRCPISLSLSLSFSSESVAKCSSHESNTRRWGHTPIDEARRFGHTPVVEMLQTYIDKELEEQQQQQRQNEQRQEEEQESGSKDETEDTKN